MGIPEKDIKLLWGRAAGRCSYCNIDLTCALETAAPIVIGEMAHVIAKEENGPRGSNLIAPNIRNSYQNLILLCPTHHTIIDKAPTEYSVEQILEWKEKHEHRVRVNNEGEKLETKQELFVLVGRLLLENKYVHDSFGPQSFVARRNPLSDIHKVWDLRKVSVIIPNNCKIISLIDNNKELISNDEFAAFVKFREHAIAFEQNTFERLDREGVPLFPSEFGELFK